jgi:cytochrome c oxidase subunit 1
MPRRVATYDPGLGWQLLNQISTVGAFMIGVSFVFLLVNVWVSWRKPVAAGDNPWDGHTLEWFATSPPAHHNFERLPSVRSERPVWDFHHPDALTITHSTNGNGKHREPASVGSGSDGGHE